jgi:putative SOS response-associated peptidase YedK
MCGRYALYAFHPKIQKHFGTTNDLDFQPRFNLSPTQTIPVAKADIADQRVVVHINATGQRVLAMARWGLIPAWVEDVTEFQPHSNAKVETAGIKPSFSRAFQSGRILVPADAFYAWQAVANGKQPWLVRLKNDEPIGLGGLLEQWQGPQGSVMTFCILTTESNPLMSKISDRMPVIVRPEDYAAWLDPEVTDIEQIQNMAKPYPESFMETYPVSRRVNDPRNDSAELIEERLGEESGEVLSIQEERNQNEKKPVFVPDSVGEVNLFPMKYEVEVNSLNGNVLFKNFENAEDRIVASQAAFELSQKIAKNSTSAPLITLSDEVQEEDNPTMKVSSQLNTWNGLTGARKITPNKDAERRVRALDAVIDRAKREAVDPKNFHSVWDVLVGFANEKEPLNPLLGLTADKDIEYKMDGERKIYKKSYLGKKMRREARKNP